MSKTILIKPDLPANRIVGTAACPNCVVRSGDPSEERRDNLGNDRRVSCVFCGRISTQVPPSATDIYREPQLIRDLVAELISTRDVHEQTFTLHGVTSGEGHGLVAHGQSLDDIMTTCILTAGDVKIEISYTGNDIKAADKPDGLIGQSYDPLVSRVPEEADQAAQKLIANGFTLVHYDIGTSLPSLTFMRGQRVSGSQKAGPKSISIIGVRATVYLSN